MISVIIIVKNEAHTIANCIRSAKELTSDILVVDTGSNDSTTDISLALGAKLIYTDWKGYGASKNIGAKACMYDWILSLDADERLTPQLIQSIKQINFANTNCVYQFKRLNYFENKKIRFGTAGNDKVIRIYNRTCVEWDLSPVHEKLKGYSVRQNIKGHLVHCDKSLEEYKKQLKYYARLCAEKYFCESKRAGIKKQVSPIFNAVRSYIFQLGFLDGKMGFELAKLIAYYTRLKYQYLSLLKSQEAEMTFTSLPPHSPVSFSKK